MADAQKNNQNKVIVGVLCALSIAAFLLIALPILTEANQYNKKNREAFRKGLALERSQNYQEAIAYYTQTENNWEDLWLWSYDFQARCHFLLGDTQKAISIYDNSYMHGGTSGRENQKQKNNPGLIAMELQQNGRFEEALISCGKLIDSFKKIQTAPRFVGSDRTDYFAGTSEGFIRKYVALQALKKEKEAEELFNQYKMLHQSAFLDANVKP